MKEVAYRAWDAKEQKMIFSDEGAVFVFPEDEQIVMDFIGINDKNGKKVYQDDIIKYRDRLWKCEYISCDCAYTLESLDVYSETKYFTDILDTDIEVIGNIYENPELLRKEK